MCFSYKVCRIFSVLCIFSLLCIACSSNAKKVTNKPLSTGIQEVEKPAPERIINIWCIDESVGAWAKAGGVSQRVPIGNRVEIRLKAADESFRDLVPMPTWVVSNEAIANVYPKVGSVIKLTIMNPGETIIKVSSGDFSHTIIIKSYITGGKFKVDFKLN